MFPLTEEDLLQSPENPFLAIINNGNISKDPMKHVIRYRDSQILIFEDKWKVSEYHLDAIPIEVIKDIKALTTAHIPLIEKLYYQGLQILENYHVPLFKDKKIADFVISGFNDPVSVPHLHLHLVLPPLAHTNAFKYPRWHSYNKVIEDLKMHGRVITYYEKPNPEEGHQYWSSMVQQNHDLLLKELKN